MKTLECNHFKETKTMTAKQKRFFDVISYQSQSYFTDEHEIRVQVGAGTKQLPPIPTSKRMRTKSCVRLMGPAESAMLAPSQDSATIAAPSREPRSADSISSMPVVNGEDHARILQLREFFYAHRMSVSAKVLLEDMPHELRSWIKSLEKPD